MNKTNINIKKNIKAISSETLNGENYSRNDFARSILNYPAMMVPSVQEPIIESLSEALNKNVSLLDPFMGASNTLVTGMKYGMDVFGQDINPLSILLSQVKTNFYQKEELVDADQRVISCINSDSSDVIEVSFTNINKWFTEDVQIDLSKIYRAIRREPNLRIRKFFWVALAETIRLTSNDRTSTFKMHMRPIEEINARQVSALKAFGSISKKNIKNFVDYISVLVEKGHIKKGKYTKKAEVVWGDTNSGINTKKNFNLLVTSPPYGDNQTTVTYGQFSYLPLQWIPLEDIDTTIEMDYLKTAQAIDNRSLGGYVKENINYIEERVFDKSKTLKKFINQFKNGERKKAEKVTRFINDLDNSIDKMLPRMMDDSFLVWTIGNRNVNKRVVQNDFILNELFASKGVNLFTDLERDILSKRMPGRNNFSDMMSKEKILIFKKTN
ncbi:TRM11 family methyltransferase [Sphingobacterium hungaricum]